MRTRVSFLSTSRSSSRAATALSTSSSRLAAEAMRVQLRQTPQKEARDWPLDQRSRGWRSHSTAMVSMRARVYFPAPLGPARMREWGRRPAAMAVRRCSMAVLLPRKSLKVAGRADIRVGLFLSAPVTGRICGCGRVPPPYTLLRKVFKPGELSLDFGRQDLGQILFPYFYDTRWNRGKCQMRNHVKGAWLLGFVCFEARGGLDMRFFGGNGGFFFAYCWFLIVRGKTGGEAWLRSAGCGIFCGGDDERDGDPQQEELG